ncbi:pentatricopeptide repeat-containing protein chloroplastic-like, partial [Trifolium medium]|nr:pentatricopeptide repeat-containing protein chloroplastic-like [Trifolium medium]
MYAKCGDIDTARMIEYPVEPNLMTMTSMITACELIGDERLGREIHGYV